MAMASRFRYLLKVQGFVGPIFECRCDYLAPNLRDMPTITLEACQHTDEV